MLVSLKRKDFDEKTIVGLSKLIDQNMLFVLDCGEKRKFAVYHGKLMQSEWTSPDDLTVTLKGLDLDAVRENIVKNLEGGEWSDELSLDENIARHSEIEKLKKEIDRLEKQARAEKQPKKKFELVQRIQRLKNEQMLALNRVALDLRLYVHPIKGCGIIARIDMSLLKIGGAAMSKIIIETIKIRGF